MDLYIDEPEAFYDALNEASTAEADMFDDEIDAALGG